MTELEMARKMRFEDNFLYDTIKQVIPDKSTAFHFEVFKKLHSQPSWKVQDIEEYGK